MRLKPNELNVELFHAQFNFEFEVIILIVSIICTFKPLIFHQFRIDCFLEP